MARLSSISERCDEAIPRVRDTALERFDSLFTPVTGPFKKIENVRTVLGWGDRAVTIPEWAHAGAQGFSHDQCFDQHRPFHVARGRLIPARRIRAQGPRPR